MKKLKAIPKLETPCLFRKSDYKGLTEKKLIFKETYYAENGETDKRYFVFTEPNKNKGILIHADTQIIKQGPIFKNNGIFIIGYNNVGTAQYIIKDNDIWFKFKNYKIVHERNIKSIDKK